ncbi:MAG: DUF4129 domain-containing protein [Acidimicrobiales bacterium]|nr:DUF4129 domain-containing protein [Acidimicrobiales bacterium]
MPARGRRSGLRRAALGLASVGLLGVAVAAWGGGGPFSGGFATAAVVSPPENGQVAPALSPTTTPPVVVPTTAAPPPPVGGTLPVPDRDPAEARRAADEVLARPEYRRPGPTLMERAQRGLAELVGRVLEAVGQGGAGAAFAWLVVLAVTAALVAAGVRVARGTRLGAVAATVRVSASRPRRPEDWLVEAEAREAEGAWRAALRCRYRALVAELAGRGVVDDVPGRTAGEERAAVARARPPIAAPFAGATELFERAWYGGLPTGPVEAERFRELAARVSEGAS